MGRTMNKVNNKKGSIAVFLTSILVSMIMVSMVFVQAARSILVASYADAVLEVAGRSVLSEFDRRLKDEYGFFAFYGLENRVAADIKFYASCSFNKTYPGEFLSPFGTITDLLKPELQQTNVSLAAYSLVDVDIFEKQIEGFMNYMIAQKGIAFIKNMWKKGGSKPEGKPAEARELKNQVEIANLPSRGNVSNGIDIVSVVSGGLPTIEQVFEEGTLNFKVCEYIMSHFKYSLGGDKGKDTFFQNEVEYILYGKMKDKDNIARLRTDFLLMRIPLNAAHIAASPEKFDAAVALSETFGPLAPVALAAIIAAWAAAEAENDARRLLDGKNVALVKTESTWALSLKSAVQTKKIRDEDRNVVDMTASPKNISKYVSPPSEDGMSYEHYLRLFLFLEKREAKLLRVMDLIQLNFRGSYYGDFLMKDHYTGFSLEANVSGKKFYYEQIY